jgi:hypothetical protein
MFKIGSIFWGLKLAKIGISNLNSSVCLLNDISGLVFQRIVVRVCKEYGVDLDILHVSLSSLFPEIWTFEIMQVFDRSLHERPCKAGA